MQNLKEGDMKALEGIYTIMKKNVYLLSNSILCSTEKAKDIMQETFIKVAQNINGYKSKNATVWICRIARNLSYTEYNKSKRSISLEVFEENISDNKNHEDIWVQNISLQNAMLRLEPLEREIVTLFAMQNYKHREIACIVERPMGTIQWLYNKAIKKLKKYMEEITPINFHQKT